MGKIEEFHSIDDKLTLDPNYVYFSRIWRNIHLRVLEAIKTYLYLVRGCQLDSRDMMMQYKMMQLEHSV